MNSTRILVVRFSSIGDIILTTPVVRALKTQLDGEVHIDFITKKSYAILLEHNPHIDEVIAIESKVSEVADRLRDGMYDYVIDLHNNLRSRQVKRYAKSLNFTLDKRNVAKWLYVQTKRLLSPIGHIVERSYEAVKPLGVVDDGKGLDVFIPESSEVSTHMLPESFRNGYVVYAIGGKMTGKVLPTEKIIELLKMLEGPVLLLGGPEDKERGVVIAQSLGANVFNACGSYSILQSASLIKQSKKVLTHDTGLMHIASALRKPVISLWFATTPELGMAPWRPGNGSLQFEADCKKRPTSKLGNRGHEDGCVFSIDLAEVAAAVNA